MDFDYSHYYDREKQETMPKYYGSLYSGIKERLCFPEKTVLDFGGGDGYLMAYLGNAHAVIADISDSGLELAKKAGFRTMKFDARKDALEKKYEIVFCMEVLEHLAQPQDVIQKVHGCLKDGGLAIFAVPIEFFKPDGVHHIQKYTPAKLRRDIEAEGFAFEWQYLKPRFTHLDYGIDAKRAKGAKSWARLIANSALSILPYGFKEHMCNIAPSMFCGFCVMAFRKNR